MKYLITYIVIAVIFESIHLIIAWKKFKNELEKKEQVKMFIQVMKQIYSQSASMKALKEKVWNWYTIPLVITPLFVFISPFLLPFSLFTLTKKALGIKSKLEIEAEKEKKLMEEAQKRSEEFMKNEGEAMFEEIIAPIKEEDNNDNNEINIK